MPGAGFLCLGSARLAVSGSPPSYVRRALSDLRAQLPDLTEQRGARRTVELRVRLRPALLRQLTRQGFMLQTRRSAVELTAAGWRGINYGILDLAARLAKSADGCSVPVGLNLRERPRFHLRGMYGHTAWVYNHPFAVRSWRLEDWQRYIDLLAYLRINLLQIWVPISIMAVPLSSADRDYLDMFRAVVDYAKEERGFSQVWVGAAANDVGLVGGSKTPVSLRQYYDRSVRALRNPGVPAQMNDIVASRRVLYEAVPNADGYWIIDSDPGGWPGSSSREFTKILLASRKLLDQMSRKRNRTRLIYWVWCGWGNGAGRRQRAHGGRRRPWHLGRVTPADKEANIRSVLGQWRRSARRRPLTLLACRNGDLSLIASAGAASRTIYFPYGVVEREPNPPYTALRFTEARAAFEHAAKPARLCGVMGNTQTPLVQLPNLWLFSRLAWDAGYRRSPTGKVLLDLARNVYPRSATELARGWRRLENDDAAGAHRQAVLLRKLHRSGQLGAAGALGRCLVQNGQWLVENLAEQLDVHAAAMDMLAGLRSGTGYAGIRGRAERYFQAAARMMHTSGYFPPTINRRGGQLNPSFNWYYRAEDWASLRAAWQTYATAHPRTAQRIWRDLRHKHGPDPGRKLVAGMIQFLVGDLTHTPEGLAYPR